MKKSKIEEKINGKRTNLVVVVRIAGEVKKKKDIFNTLYRLRLRRKYACTLINPENKGMVGMLEKVKHYIAYGYINEETLIELLKARGKKLEKSKEIDYEKAVRDLISGKKLKELGFKPFFRLHPPRKGIKSKLQYPRGVLGDNRENINKLIERML